MEKQHRHYEDGFGFSIVAQDQFVQYGYLTKLYFIQLSQKAANGFIRSGFGLTERGPWEERILKLLGFTKSEENLGIIKPIYAEIFAICTMEPEK